MVQTSSAFSVLTASDADFLELLAVHPRAVVKYHADWCGYCRLFAPRFARLAGEFPNLAFLAVNAEFNPVARRLGGVHHLPFFAAFEHGRLLRNHTATEEAEVVDFINAIPWTTQP